MLDTFYWNSIHFCSFFIVMGLCTLRCLCWKYFEFLPVLYSFDLQSNFYIPLFLFFLCFFSLFGVIAEGFICGFSPSLGFLLQFVPLSLISKKSGIYALNGRLSFSIKKKGNKCWQNFSLLQVLIWPHPLLLKLQHQSFQNIVFQ